MKKYLLSFSLIAAFVLFSLHEQKEEASVQVIPPKNTTGLSQNSSSPDTSHSSSVSMPSDTPPPISSGSNNTINKVYRDGEYTGSIVDVYYGNIQVKAVIQNGKINDVTFLQYPNDRSTSVAINMQAMPYLKQEAIQAQNAQVDIVSGATDTSEGFQQSLQSALDQAKNS